MNNFIIEQFFSFLYNQEIIRKKLQNHYETIYIMVKFINFLYLKQVPNDLSIH